MEEKPSINKLHSLAEEENLDIIVMTAPDNIEYFLGIRTIADSPLLLIYSRRDEKIAIYTSLLEYYRFRDTLEPRGVEVIALSRHLKPGDARVTDKKWSEIIEGITGYDKIGFDKGMQSPLKQTVLEKLGGKIVDVSKKIWKYRMIKEDWEIRAIKKAVEITGKGIFEAVNNLKPSTTEAETAGFFEQHVRRHGIDEYAFPPLILFKPGNSYPHNLPGEKKLGRNNLVLLDVGVKVAGRCSDITRMAPWGKPSMEEEKIMEIVSEAIDEVIDKAEPGMTGEEIYMLAYKVIEKNGYGERFIHGLGHGFGVLVHEQPYISSGVKTVIEPGTVFTVEPGIYLPGRFGVRIEEDVLMTKKGLKVLSSRIPRIIKIF